MKGIELCEGHISPGGRNGVVLGQMCGCSWVPLPGTPGSLSIPGLAQSRTCYCLLVPAAMETQTRDALFSCRITLPFGHLFAEPGGFASSQAWETPELPFHLHFHPCRAPGGQSHLPVQPLHPGVGLQRVLSRRGGRTPLWGPGVCVKKVRSSSIFPQPTPS